VNVKEGGCSFSSCVTFCCAASTESETAKGWDGDFDNLGIGSMNSPAFSMSNLSDFSFPPGLIAFAAFFGLEAERGGEFDSADRGLIRSGFVSSSERKGAGRG
jgi:hypothetical protein